MKPTENVGQRYQKIHHAGDIYHPQDLNDARYQDQLRQRRGRPNPPTEDPFDVLGLDPLHEYKNYRLLSHFVSDMGKILPREKTGKTNKIDMYDMIIQVDWLTMYVFYYYYYYY